MMSTRKRHRAAEPQEEHELEFSEAPVKKVTKCKHQVECVYNMCVLCGGNLDGLLMHPMGKVGCVNRPHKDLRLAPFKTARLSSPDMKTLLQKRKLYLFLDLDLTLLHTTMLKYLTPDEAYLKTQSDSLEDVSKGSLFILEHMGLITKLRPFVRTFLREASQMFEMYINTMGFRPYAQEMAKLLDPRDEYFSGRITSRDDHDICTHRKDQKSLEVLQGRERAVEILDDTSEVWRKHKDNLIVMEGYNFFASCRPRISLSQLKTDERELDGALAHALKKLKRIHRTFFKEPDCSSASRDTRQLLRWEQKYSTQRVAAMPGR